MPSVNRVVLIGHAGKDAEKKYLPNGSLIANFSVATSEKFKDKSGEWQEKTDWHNVSIFGDKAEWASEVKKGELVFVEGKISYRSWVDPQGVKKYATDIVANSVKRLIKSEHEETSGEGFDDEPAPTVEPDDEGGEEAESLEKLGLG